MTDTRTDFEKAVIYCILQNDAAMDYAASHLSPDDFSNRICKQVFKACFSLYADAEAMDLIQIGKRLRTEKNGQDTLKFALSLYNSQAFTISNYKSYILGLKEESIRSKSVQILQSVSSRLLDGQDVFSLLASLETELAKIQNIKLTNQNTLQSFAYDAIETSRKIQAGEQQSGIKTGLQSIDRNFAGFRPGELTVIGARPGMGKSAFILNLILNAAKQDKKCALFSLEMTGESFGSRAAVIEYNIQKSDFDTELSNFLFETGKYSLDINGKLTDCINSSAYYLSNVFVNDTGGVSLYDIKATARTMARAGELDLLAVDYLQLIDINTLKGDNRNHKIGEVTRELKALAKELKVPIIVLSQLSRDVERRENKKPRLSDLRDSGEIEQDVDIAFMLYRPEYYGIGHTESGEPTKDLLLVSIEKNRHGLTGEVWVDYKARTNQITDLPGLTDASVQSQLPEKNAPF